MRHYLALHVWHARVQSFQQCSIKNFMTQMRLAKVSAKNFQEPFTDFVSTHKQNGGVKYRIFFLVVFLPLPELFQIMLVTSLTKATW